MQVNDIDRARLGWLKTHFGTVAHIMTPTEESYSVPLLYQMCTMYDGDENPVAVLSSFSQQEDLAGRGLELLIDQILTKAQIRNLRLFCPQNGQSIHTLQPDKKYRIVYRDDPEHDHQSLRLANFINVQIYPDMTVEKTDLNGNHCHLLLD